MSSTSTVTPDATLEQAVVVAEPTNVLIVGVGGQGVIMVSKILARLSQLQGLQVKQSEVHGMAKRGGSVFSHIRFGEEVWSPTIPMGEADVVLGLEWAEGLRWLRYLKPGVGTFISDTKRIVPPFSCRDRSHDGRHGYAHHTVAEIVAQVPSAYAPDATGMATELGNERVANTILLGVLSTVMDFPLETWREVLAEFVPPKTLDTNLEAFEAGRAWTQQAHEPVLDEPSVQAPSGPTLRRRVSLEITESWCKSCDICVKMCPERCLALDERQIVELVNPEACTGCRVCEWLCPDFAIAVHVTTVPTETTTAEIIAVETGQEETTGEVRA
jgi:indolepyruvate ferredoxin oxidoreductase beta subunit